MRTRPAANAVGSQNYISTNQYNEASGERCEEPDPIVLASGFDQRNVNTNGARG
ncbi:hypothetical protein SH528x_000782 [Novipirellula sp. SH528]|uniref:hypothetical protein n=1 Tax=Novipirellula sp. SH528 TaxID=3454466 RepID=UPI003F9F33BF